MIGPYDFETARGLNSSGTQIYITMGELFVWAYNHQNDATYGHCYTELKAAFEKIAEFFDGTIQIVDGLQPGQYYDPQGRTSDGAPLILSMPVICDEDDIQDIFMDNYNIRSVYVPLYFRPYQVFETSEDKRAESVCNKLCGRITRFCKLNKFKYIRLLQILNFEYNPIENYNMKEHSDDSLDYTGERSLEREVTASKLNGLEISGPVSTATIGQDGTLSVAFDLQKKISTTVDQVSDNEMGGKTAGTPEVPSVGTGTDSKSSHYTTTYDDATEGRLESYDEAEGTSATATKGISKVEEPVYGKAYSGNPNYPSYTDTESFTGRSDDRSHDMWRKGNIGVMTTQQMIEQERLVAEGFNLVQQFLDELSKEIFLQCW